MPRTPATFAHVAASAAREVVRAVEGAQARAVAKLAESHKAVAAERTPDGRDIISAETLASIDALFGADCAVFSNASRALLAGRPKAATAARVTRELRAEGAPAARFACDPDVTGALVRLRQRARHAPERKARAVAGALSQAYGAAEALHSARRERDSLVAKLAGERLSRTEYRATRARIHALGTIIATAHPHLDVTFTGARVPVRFFAGTVPAAPRVVSPHAKMLACSNAARHNVRFALSGESTHTNGGYCPHCECPIVTG